jgi:protocatechuate 3,4-dioxygenase beta subunit
MAPAPPRLVATTDVNGRFTYDPSGATAGLRNAMLVATAKVGAAPDWALLNQAGAEMTLRLAHEVPIRGRLLDLEGKPVAGAVVKVLSIGTFPDGDLQPALNAMRLNPEWLHFGKNIRPLAPAFATQTKTKADGRFELTGIGKDRVAVLRFEAPGIESATAHVVTRPGFDPKVVLPGPKDEALKSRFVPGLRLTVYGPTFTHPARPSHEITGTVTDAATGKPIPNVTIIGAAGPTHFTGEPYWGNSVESRTDRTGRFRLSGLPRASRRSLHAQPGDSPYLDQVVEVKDAEALTPAAVEIKLDRCVVIQGRITDKVTGKAVKGEAHYLPLADNTDLKALPNARLYKGGLLSARPTGTWASSDEDGKFKLRVLRGGGVILVRADTDRDPSARYPAIRVAEEDRKHLQKRDPDAIRTTRTKNAKGRDRSQEDEAFSTASLTWPLRWENGYAIINPAAKDLTVNLHIRLDPGRTVHGKVVGPDGKAVAGAKAIGVQATNERRPTTFRGDTFTAYALVTGRPREMVFVHSEKKLAGTITVRPEDKKPVVKLQPWAVIAGRVLNPDGTPAANAAVSFQFTDGIADELIRQKLYKDRQQLRTGKDGRFRLEGMFPGQEVWVSAQAPGLRVGAGSGAVIPKPGETVEVGHIELPSSRK